jgi:FkbM family methyltransferase
VNRLRELRDRLIEKESISKIIGLIWFFLPTFLRIRLPIYGQAVGFKFTRNFKVQKFYWKLDPGELIGRKYLKGSFRGYETNTEKYIVSYVSNNFKNKRIVFLNVGANVGFWSVRLNLDFPLITHLLVEPLPKNISLLEENLRLNKITDYKLYPYAFGSQDGSHKIYVNNSLLGTSSLIFETDDYQVIQLRKGDNLIREFVNLVLIDVEGYEIETIKGLRNLILRCRPTIICETSLETLLVLSGIMDELGYEKPIKLGIGEVFSAQEKNFLFIPK